MSEANRLKARIALEALQGEKTAARIARVNAISPAPIREWKKQLQERLGEGGIRIGRAAPPHLAQPRSPS